MCVLINGDTYYATVRQKEAKRTRKGREDAMVVFDGGSGKGSQWTLFWNVSNFVRHQNSPQMVTVSASDGREHCIETITMPFSLRTKQTSWQILVLM